MSGPVIVSGATGFVGRHVTARLQASGLEVVGFSRRGRDARHVSIDISDRDAVLSFFERYAGAQAVVHLAAIAHRPSGVTAQEMDRVNRQGAEHMIDGARSVGISRFVFVSTASVYGELRRERILTEDLSPQPIGPYAVAKARAEEYCLAKGPGTTVVLRPPAIYSAGWLLDVRKRAYVPGLSGKVLLRVLGQQPQYSLCALDNAVEAIARAAGGSVARGIYNVADESPYSQRAVATAVAQRDGVRRWLPLPAILGRTLMPVLSTFPGNRSKEVQANLAKLFNGQVLDIGRMRSQGYNPEASLSDLVDAND